jgi:hypothetical protein
MVIEVSFVEAGSWKDADPDGGVPCKAERDAIWKHCLSKFQNPKNLVVKNSYLVFRPERWQFAHRCV